jgi:long-chain fatty acid transport protein
MKPFRIGLAVQAAATAGIGLLSVSTPHASGFAIPEISIAGLGTANALAANPEELGAIPYNPAAMSFHDSSSISAGLMFFSPSPEVRTATGSHSSEGEDTLVIPAFQGVYRVNDRWSLGLGANAPFGLETAWPLGTFPLLSVPLGPFPAGILHPTESTLELLGITPTLSYRIGDELSLSAGLDYYDARKLLFNTHLLTIRGDGDAWGWNLAALYRSGPFSIGASYHSEATADLSGTYTLFGTPSVDADADLDLPSRLQLGIRYAFTDQLAVELDWTRLGWSNFTEIVVKASDSGAVLTRSANHWDDADAYRLGLTYDITEATQLRLGYAYDQTGQTAEFYSARIPDADRQLFSIGLAHDLGDGWSLEGGYMYVKFDDEDFRADRPFNPLVNRDVNGTSALNGDYSAHVHIFGIGISKSFL